MNARVYLSMLKDQPEVVSVSEVAKILRIGKKQSLRPCKERKPVLD